MERSKHRQIPAFGNWDYCDDMPITQYFESARQAGLARAGFSRKCCEEGYCNVPVAMPVKLAYQDGLPRRKKQRNQGKQKPKAVDEDLYKIPPELLYQKPKKERSLRNLFSGCLGFSRSD